MTVKDLIRAEKKEAEEEDRALDELELVNPQADDEEEKLSPDDEMFCTAAGAVSVRPKAGNKSLLRRLLSEADRA